MYLKIGEKTSEIKAIKDQSRSVTPASELNLRFFFLNKTQLQNACIKVSYNVKI